MNKYYVLTLIAAFATSVSQIMLNISADKTYKNKIFEYLNPWVIASYGILMIVLIVNSYIMKFINLKDGHALAASTYIFVLILSRIILKEKITPKKIIGNALIIIGIIVFVWL